MKDQFIAHLYAVVEGFEFLVEGLDKDNPTDRDYRLGLSTATVAVRTLFQQHHIRKPKLKTNWQTWGREPFVEETQVESGS